MPPRSSAPLSARFGFVIALLATAGCEEAVALGGECPQGDTCVTQSDGGEISVVRPNTPGYVDGGAVALPTPAVEDGAGADAGAPGASIITPPAAQRALLSVRNPSFERNGGIGGDVLLNDLVDQIFGVIPPVTLIIAALPDWYACVPFSVSSTTWSVDETGVSTSKFGDYLSFLVNGTSVRQELEAPIRARTTYAFELDVISQSQGAENLFVEVRGAPGQCEPGVVLGRSPVVKDSPTWQRTCVTFTADRDYSHLLLAPNAEGGSAALGASLRMDGLRQVERCD